jgi:hypothetical protein
MCPGIHSYQDKGSILAPETKKQKEKKEVYMGTSKVILLSGIYLILGFYTVSFTAADETNFSSALTVATKSQAEQLSKTGVSLALQRFANNLAMTSIGTTNVSTLGGSVEYSASQPVSFPATQTQIISTGTYNGVTVQTTAVFHQFGGRWKVLRVYSKTV